MVQSCDAIIVGAGPAGLATAAALRARGLDAAILEKSDAVGAVWRRHYDRLHLHTDRARSGLPGLPIPKAYGRYPSRAHMVDYLEAYASKFALRPVFNAPVRALRREGGAWRADAEENSRIAPIVVVATGWADYPYAPTWPGIETFGGEILHSSSYRNPAPFAGRRVLVVGSGNSGAEIALDLAETGIDVALSVRSPVNVIPRELFGVPILVFPTAEQWLPPRLADAINAPLLRYAIGSIEKLGLKRAAKGPLQSIAEDGRVPLIDVGTLDAIRDGRIKLRGDVASFSLESVGFSAVARRAVRCDHSRDRLPPGPSLPAARRQGRAGRRRSAARQRPSHSGARSFLLRRHSFGNRAIPADRHRGAKHRRRSGPIAQRRGLH